MIRKLINIFRGLRVQGINATDSSDNEGQPEGAEHGTECFITSCYDTDSEFDSFLSPQLTAESMDRYFIRASILNAITEFLPHCSGTLLDVGCGKMPYKSLTFDLKAKVSYVGLDIENPNYQQTAKPDLFWDGETIPLEDSSVDNAMATELFEHLPEPEKVMREVFRVLKPNGKLFFTVPFLWPLHDVPHDEYRYTPFALQRHLRNIGFGEIIIRPLGGWDASLAQMIGLWTRRKPMSAAERAKVSCDLFPFYRELIERDEKPTHFLEGQMITGLYGTASKSDMNPHCTHQE